MTRCAWLKPCLWAAIVVLLVCGLPAWVLGQSPASGPPAAGPAPPPLAADAPCAVSGPSADDLAAGDPSGTKTGTANDVVHADPAKPLTLADVVNQAGQNRIAINFTWTLVTGFLVMFMQAGFAIVETGLVPRQECEPHHDDELHGLRLRLVRLLVCGFAIQMGGAAGVAILGGASPLITSSPYICWASHWGFSGTKGSSCRGATYDVGVMVLFLFQMVFMDTALTIVTGAAAERWKLRLSHFPPFSWEQSPIPSSATGLGVADGFPSWAQTTDSARVTPILPGRGWCTRSVA